MKKITNTVFHVSDGVSLRDYIDQRLSDVQRAVDKAQETMDKRLEGMNEFRDTLKDQASRFVTRDELQSTLKPIIANLQALQKLSDIAWGKASAKSLFYTAAMAAVALLLGIVRLLTGK